MLLLRYHRLPLLNYKHTLALLCLADDTLMSAGRNASCVGFELLTGLQLTRRGITSTGAGLTQEDKSSPQFLVFSVLPCLSTISSSRGVADGFRLTLSALPVICVQLGTTKAPSCGRELYTILYFKCGPTAKNTILTKRLQRNIGV